MRISHSIYILLFLFFTAIGACKKEEDTFPEVLASVTANAMTSVTSSAAIGGGKIIDDGGSTVTDRGVCYSTTSDPTLSNSFVSAGGGASDFSCNISGLQPNTTYYLRAYAINSKGTAYSSNEVVFKTSTAEPSLTTSDAFSVTGNDAAVTGVIADNGGATILTRGICYSTSANPTISDSVVYSSSPTTSFSLTLPGLLPLTTYYVRAFATSSSGTGYGNQISFTTTDQVFAIGEYYNGGIIFYLDDSQIHGLIVATSDQSTSADWGCAGQLISGADGIAVGDGPVNTADITASCSSSTNAAAICANLNWKGYSDWNLPSKGDLDLINKNLHLQGLGSFSIASYWSSTEYDANSASSFNFNTGTQSNANKNSPYSVRAVRSF